jgi:hypothetical protein
MYVFLQNKDLAVWILVIVIIAIWYAIPEDNSIKKFIKKKK